MNSFNIKMKWFCFVKLKVELCRSEIYIYSPRVWQQLLTAQWKISSILSVRVRFMVPGKALYHPQRCVSSIRRESSVNADERRHKSSIPLPLALILGFYFRSARKARMMRNIRCGNFKRWTCPTIKGFQDVSRPMIIYDAWHTGLTIHKESCDH